MAYWLVGDGKLSKVFAYAFWLYFQDIKMFSVVDRNNTTNHIWHNNHITKVGLDWFWYRVRADGGSCTLGGTKLLYKTVVFRWDPTSEATAGTGS